MKLTQDIFANSEAWEQAGIALPSFSREELVQATTNDPTWIHFGAGNIFRAFPAAVLQEVLNKGDYDKGVIVAEGFDPEIIPKAYQPFDNLSLLVTLKADGTTETTVVASITEALDATIGTGEDWERLEQIFIAPSLAMASFTITEKGYEFLGETGVMARVTTLLLERFRAGGHPIAMVSMDNVSQNGDKLKKSVLTIAKEWVAQGKAEQGFVDYLSDASKVSFPWSMIDKITPHPDKAVQTMLEQAGISGMEPIATERNTYTAGFVNAEEVQYMVIEDSFPNGRPPIETSGVLFTDRETVDKVETMKVTTCLNPLHTALAIFGCLLEFQTIHEEMKDPDLLAMVKRLGYQEGMPVVVNPGIIDPEEFIREVIEIRFPNPFMPDTPQRIATDTSQKLAIRFGETVKSYVASDTLSTKDLEIIPLVFAAWCRYLMGVDDSGNSFSISPDPRLDEVREYVKGVSLGKPVDGHATLEPLLSDDSIFGVDLYQVGLGEKTEKYFEKLVSGPGAVRETLHQAVK